MSLPILSFDVLMNTLLTATPQQQWDFKTFLDGITQPARVPIPVSEVADPLPEVPLPLPQPLPLPVVPVPETKAAKEPKEKKVRKATKAVAPAPVVPAAEEVKLLEPVDAPKNTVVVSEPAAPVDLTIYRLAVVNPALCIARKIDKKTPIPGTRPEDPGSNGKFYPELQCSKKPLSGSKLCKICAEKHAEASKPENAKKAVESYYGLLDETELYWNSQIVGSEKFNKKYPKGLTTISNTALPAPAPAMVPVLEHVEAVTEAVAVPVKKKPVRKATKAEPAPTTDASTNAASTDTHEEWELFLFEGIQYIRHKTTHNCYLVNGEEHDLVRMARRDAYEGKWRDGAIDRYAQEDEA